MSIFAYLKNAQIVHTTQKCMITHRFITIILIIKCPPKAEGEGIDKALLALRSCFARRDAFCQPTGDSIRISPFQFAKGFTGFGCFAEIR